MKRLQRKPYSGRRAKEGSFRHWLGEGTAGQESLLLELEPGLYVIDQTVSSLCTSIAHMYTDGEKQPFAVLVPPSGCIGWQIAYLSKMFNVYVWSGDVDEIMVEAADQFNVMMVSGELSAWVENEIDFFLHTDCCWMNLAQFCSGVRDVCECLSPSGKTAFVLKGKGARDSLALDWRDGSRTSLSEIVKGEYFRLSPPDSVWTISLSEIDPYTREMLGGFLKRNRSFFGRNVRDQFIQRMREVDFAGPFTQAADEPEWVCLLVWESEAKGHSRLAHNRCHV